METALAPEINLSTYLLPERTLTFFDYLHPFLCQMDAEKTRKDYLSELRLFSQWVQKPVQGVTPLDIIAYRKYLEDKGLKVTTVYRKLSILRSFHSFLHQTFGLRNPALAVRLPKVTDESSKSVLTLQEAMRFLTVIDHKTILGLRDRAMMSLLLICGMRTVEVSRANVGDLHEVEGFKVLRVRGKGSKIADVKIRADIFDALTAYLRTRGDAHADEALFLSHGNCIKNTRIQPQGIQLRVLHYFQKTGISRPNLSAHSLRHSCAILCLTVGKVDVLAVQRLLRHANVQTTLKYLKNIDSLRDNAVDRHPVSLPPIA